MPAALGARRVVPVRARQLEARVVLGPARLAGSAIEAGDDAQPRSDEDRVLRGSQRRRVELDLVLAEQVDPRLATDDQLAPDQLASEQVVGRDVQVDAPDELVRGNQNQVADDFGGCRDTRALLELERQAEQPAGRVGSMVPERRPGDRVEREQAALGQADGDRQAVHLIVLAVAIRKLLGSDDHASVRRDRVDQVLATDAARHLAALPTRERVPTQGLARVPQQATVRGPQGQHTEAAVDKDTPLGGNRIQIAVVDVPLTRREGQLERPRAFELRRKGGQSRRRFGRQLDG